MGAGFSGPFSETWDGVGPVFRECARTGHSQRRVNDPVPLDRHGYLEETFITWSIVPIYGGTEQIRKSGSVCTHSKPLSALSRPCGPVSLLTNSSYRRR
jgi:hypothetical protein